PRARARRPRPRSGGRLAVVACMSERNVELNRRWFEAFNASNIEALIALCDPEIEFHSWAAVGGATYYGHDGMRSSHKDLHEAWAEIRLDVETYFDLGDQMLAFY